MFLYVSKDLMLIKRKKSFVRNFSRKYPLHLHMTGILLATALSGFLFSRATLAFSVDNFVIRYPLAVVFSYLVFFVCIELWILYISRKRSRPLRDPDWLDLPSPSLGGSGGSPAPPLPGGGGSFGGGGASGHFAVDPSAATEASVSAIAEGTSAAAEGIIGSVGDAAGAAGEGIIGGVVVLLLISVIVATILGNAVLVFSEAPLILSEAAFEGLLAASLVKKTRNIDHDDWVGSVLKSTWKSFTSVLAVTVLVALYLHHSFPEATRLSDIVRALSSR
jgi:hypothetical protein